jgi:hypothetical protein
VAGQLEYAANGGAAGSGDFNPGATMGQQLDRSEFLDSRAEAKKAHAERMLLLRQVRAVGLPVLYLQVFLALFVLLNCYFLVGFFVE